jgi:polygalacturonase
MATLNVINSQLQDPSNTYLRPILLYTENMTNFEVNGIHFLNSPCWNTFFVESNNIKFDGVRFDSISNNASALPKNSDGLSVSCLPRILIHALTGPLVIRITSTASPS